jgi:hypothetical protein
MSTKFYIHQLFNNKMLVLEDGIFSVEELESSTPDCVFTAGNKTYRGQDNIISAILGYQLESSTDFMKEVETWDSMSFNDFKLKVQANNIGGGCPDRVKLIASDALENNIDYIQAMFKHILPSRYIDNSCALPSSTDILDEYKTLIALNWHCKYNKPNNKFKNNIIMYLGVRDFTDEYVDFLRDVLSICAKDVYKSIFKYFSIITTANGSSAILLIDSYSSNADIEYFYASISGVDLADGYIDVTDTEEGYEVSFVCTDKSLESFYATKKPLNINVKHYIV